MWIPTNWKVFRDRSTRSPYLSPEKHACRSRRTEQGIEQLTGSKLKHLPAMQETWVQSLGWEDPLEKEMATHSSILAWRIPWTREPGGLQSTGSQRVGHDWATSFSVSDQSRIVSPCLFNLYAEYIMWNVRLDESQAGIKIAGRSIDNLRYADYTTLMAESEEKLEGLLVGVTEESEKSWLETQHSKN